MLILLILQFIIHENDAYLEGFSAGMHLYCTAN